MGALLWDVRMTAFILGTCRWGMNLRTGLATFGIFVAAMLAMPATGRAQSTGQVECPRAGGYVYLYSSMTTLEVRTTLQCKELVHITGRYDGYFGVRTAKGDVGYVPQDSLLMLKDAPGVKKSSLGAPPPVDREPVAYDDPALRAKPKLAAPSGPDFVLKNNTIVHVAVVKGVSSATAHVGDTMELEVSEDLIVEGLVVIPKGAAAAGAVTEVEQKKRLGRSGKLGMKITDVSLGNGGRAPVRAYHDTTGATSATGAVLPMVSGKDVEFPKGTDFLAWVDGDVKLKRADFPAVATEDSLAPGGSPVQ